LGILLAVSEDDAGGSRNSAEIQVSEARILAMSRPRHLMGGCWIGAIRDAPDSHPISRGIANGAWICSTTRPVLPSRYLYRHRHDLTVTANYSLRGLVDTERLHPTIVRRLDDMFRVVKGSSTGTSSLRTSC
jgi:hypothetical protein